MTLRNALLTAAACVPAAMAQAGAYAQCGGIGWSGATSCVSGYTCVTTNAYFSQCTPNAPGGAPPSGAAPSTVAAAAPTAGSGAATTSAPAAAATPDSTNPFSGVAMYAHPYYASEISAYAIPSLTGAMATKAAAVAKTPTFVWLDTLSKVNSTLGLYLSNIQAANKAGASPPIAGTFVVYDLPNRDCAALASNGEYSVADGGVAKYKNYIDTIKTQLVKYSDVRTILAVEPDSLGNLVTNLNVAKCQAANDAYQECIEYAMKTLDLPNVSMYLDAGHAGWLGWDSNIGPAAELFGKVFKAAGSPKAVRGLMTNVANYNPFDGPCASFSQGNKNCNEQKYVAALAPLLTAAGFPAHFIMDTGRNGKQPTGQVKWGDWCNIKGTGFGVRPTANTGDPLEDAFVWIKPGGECDGTSNTSAVRYDATCGLDAALKPAPEAGTWFEAYFEQLLTNANPPL